MLINNKPISPSVVVSKEVPPNRFSQRMAVPRLKRLVASFPLRRSGFASGQHLGFVVDKAALGQVFSEYFGFSC
jgi:hypothetical protein